MSDIIVNRGSKSSKEQVKLLKNALQYNVELFSGGEEIWPDQCDYAISRLESVKIIVQDHCRLFDNNLCSSAVETVEQLDSRVTVTLHYAYKQLSELQTLIAAFQPACRSISKHIRKKRAEILSKLELFMLNSEEVIKGIASLEERGGQRRRIHHFSETCDVIPPLPDEGPSYHRYQQQQIAVDKSDYIPRVKPLSPHLTPVKDDYIEERNASKQGLTEEECIVLLNDDKQERGDTVADNILPFMKNSIRRYYSTPNNSEPCS